MIKSDVDNPLWQKYIDWINNTYKQSWIGRANAYYGYDGNKNFNGTNAWDSVIGFENNPTLITLEEWDECVNGYKFTPEYCKTHKVAIHVNTPDEVRRCDELLNNKAHYYLYKNLIYKGGNQGINTEDNCHTNIEWYQQHGYKVIKAKDFIKFNSKNMEKKVIGYKLVKTEYNDAALKIAQLSSWAKYDYGHFAPTSIVERRFEKAGVLDLWFEPVYEDDKLKVGDFIIITGLKGDKEKFNGDVVEITRISADDYHELWIRHTPNSFSGGGFGYKPYKDNVRKATSEEIKAYKSFPNVTIKGYKAEETSTGVKFGCQSYTKEFVITLADCLETNGFKMDHKDDILKLAKYFKTY